MRRGGFLDPVNEMDRVHGVIFITGKDVDRFLVGVGLMDDG